jgi:NAD(P)-dependent dehydrogenase (short-subunit alcohol dehydrogenase family)
MSSQNSALITGSSKRLGKEMAIFLAKQGYNIAISYKDSKEEALILAKKIEEEYKVEVGIFQSDLKNYENAKNLINEVLKVFPNLNLLINNASIFDKSKMLEENEDFAEEQLFNNLNIHLISPLFLSKIFAKNVKMKGIKNAQIINMIDKNIARFDTNYFYYLLSKKFLAELTKMSALQLSPEVRVNGIAPGFILNSIGEKNPENEDNKITPRIPLKRKGGEENIVQSLEFLLKNNFINGQIISVDGGASLNHAG